MTINFKGTATISYKSPKEFDKIVNENNAKEVGIFPQYTYKHRVSSNDSMYTKNANTCSILQVNDTMLHLAPEIRSYRLMDDISDLVKSKFDKTGDVTAIIIGGQACDKESFNLFNDIGNVLEKEGADFSMLCGKNIHSKNGRDALCKLDKDTFIFTQEDSPNFEELVKQNKSLTPDGLKRVFEMFYSYVDISPKHKIIK